MRHTADPPAQGTREYGWWAQGAADEAAARSDGMCSEAIQVRDTLEALERARSRRHGHRLDDAVELAESLAVIFYAGQPFTRRLALAWRLIRG